MSQSSGVSAHSFPRLDSGDKSSTDSPTQRGIDLRDRPGSERRRERGRASDLPGRPASAASCVPIRVVPRSPTISNLPEDAAHHGDHRAIRAAPDPPQERPYRTPPHNLEAEQALLGAILINNDAFDRVSDFLRSEHFVEEIHRRIFEIAGSLIRAGKLATPVTLKTFLGEHDLGGVTVPQYLARLASEATTIINAYDYGRSVYDLAMRRELISIGEDVVNVAYDAPVDSSPREQIEEAERRLYQIAEAGRYDGGFQRFSEALKIAVDMAASAYEREGSLSGVATGLTDLDRYMGGLQASDLVILAGRPGMGKTALATNIAFNIAKAYEGANRAPTATVEAANGGIVGFFSLEMSAEQLATRIIAEQSGGRLLQDPPRRHHRGRLPPRRRRGARDAADSRSTSTRPAASRSPSSPPARGASSASGASTCWSSTISSCSPARRARSDNRVQELTEITTGLKALAKELNIPILACSQLSRQVEQRDDKRPQLSDLRESGSIEQDADVVLFVYREEYYLKNQEPRPGTEEHIAWMAQMESAHGRAEVIIGKQRHGPTGTVELQFDAEVTRFSTIAREDTIPEIR